MTVPVMMSICLMILAFAFPSEAQTVAKKKLNPLDKGDFKVGFSPSTKARNPKKVIPKDVKEPLQELANSLNEMLALPHDVYLNFDDCGEPNAFYSPATKEITMCYEFLSLFAETFSAVSDDEAEVEDHVANTMVFFFFHELGHCLIDVWDLPATGREEDAVDQLAMVILLDGTPEGESMVASASLFFILSSGNQEDQELAFWDEHSLDQQRFYDTVCLAYGSNPSKNKDLIGENGLPEERAGRCPSEFQRANRAWQKLLEPYLQP